MKMKTVFGLSIAFLIVGLVGCNDRDAASTEKTENAEKIQSGSDTASLDTGVGKNGMALASSPAFEASGGEMATMENVVRAETAKYLAAETLQSGPNTFRHERQGIDLDNQTVIRSNFDAIYSYGVFDISDGLTITIPEYDLLQLVQVLDENSVTIGVAYPGDTLTLDKSDVSYGDHVYLFMRTQPRSYDEKGMEEMRQRQDAVTVKAGSAKPYVSEVKYDVDSFNKLRGELITRAVTEGVIEEGFIDDIEDIKTPQYQMINLAGWAGLPAKHAYYFVVLPGDEGAKKGEPSSVTFMPPNLRYEDSGYWSITIYDEKGWVVTEPFNTNSNKAEKNADGSITLNFNGAEGVKNNIQVKENWNALFRCYLPVSVEEMVEYRKHFTSQNKVLAVDS